jgi:multidrug resistance efflux pump
LKIGITAAATFVLSTMQPTIHREAELGELETAYQAAWRRFTSAVSRLQCLRAKEAVDTLAVRDAEMAMKTAEAQYRQARNALAGYMLEQSPSERVLAGSR